VPQQRNPKNMDKLSEKTKFIIDSFACYHSPARIYKGINENFGDKETIKVGTILGYKVQYENLILERRKELIIELPIMNPASRFAMAQEIYDMAMDGIARVVKGEVINIPDAKVALEAVRIAHSMSTTKEIGEVMDSDIIRGVVKEAYEQIRGSNPDMTDGDVVALLMSSLEEDARPYIEELHTPLN